MAAPKIKTLLIEDSGFMRIFLSDILRKDDRIELIATANNGKEGVEKAMSLKPDVIITDMMMPEYDGLYVVRQLMKEMPLPIILLSTLDRTNPQIFDALREGAFDFLDKPQGKDSIYQALTQMVVEASMTDYLKLRKKSNGKNTSVHAFDPKLNFDIIVIGASTGGPSAVEHIVNNIPNNLSIPVIIVQHMPERFIETFASRLADSTGLRVSVLREGECLIGNHIYLAPGTSNIKLNRDSG
jgi:two-component system chemotaxis response regulator CheB